MSRHRRQQRKRMRRPRHGLTQAQAERFACAVAAAPPIEPFEPNAYVFRQAPAGVDATDAFFEIFGMRREVPDA